MPTYSIQAPDGNTYQIDGPAGASQDQVQAEVMRQHPSAGAPAAPAKPSAFDSLVSGAKNLYGSYLEPMATIASGTILKPVGDLAGLGAAAYGAATGNKDIDPQGIQQSIQDLTYQPKTPAGKATTAAIGKILSPIGTFANWTGDFYANALHALGAPDSVVQGVKNGTTETVNQSAGYILGGAKADVVDAAKAGLRSQLIKLESKAAPRVKAAVADAQTVAPDMQTITQTTGSPFLSKIGQGAAGSKTAEASADIVDKLAGGMTEQAKSIAPLGVSNPEVASQVQKVLQQKDADLSQRADAVYTSGRSAVAKQPGMVATPNTVGAVDQMLAEANDPRILAPPVVTKRLQGLVDTLRPGGASWGDFYDLRKQINTLYDEVPRDAITPSMDQTFARLKSAYYQDLEAAPAGAAKNTTVKANQIYQGLQDERETLSNSVVASVLGKDGKTSIANPDQVLDRLVGLQPSAQSYVRNILDTYSPQTLDQLRSYAITKNVQDAARTGTPATVSATEPRKLTPGALADSGLFTPEQAAELRSRESALRTALNALPEKGAPTAEVTPQSAGRLIGGNFSPTFLGGTMANVLTQGALERALNTPAGRNAILAVPKSGPTATPARMFVAAVLAQVAAERASAQKTGTASPLLGPSSPGTQSAVVPPQAAPAPQQ